MKNQFYILFSLLLFFGFGAYAQVLEPDSLYQIETRDGNVYSGKFLGTESDSLLRFNTNQLGNITLRGSQIKKFEIISSSRIKGGRLWPVNLHPTRYFFAPNGYNLRKGEGYYQNIWVLFNQVSYGFSDNFSLGVGMVPLFLFGDGAATPVWITPKVGIPLVKNKVNLGIGAFLGTTVGGDENSGFLGTFYSTLSIGGKDYNLSTGIGFGVADGKVYEIPYFNVSGLARISRKSFLMTENYFGFNGENILISVFGLRTIGKNVAFDYGLLKLTDFNSNNSDFLFLPWLGIGLPFGKTQSPVPLRPKS